ncbi:hypothetical protein WISP_01059 [Willisornis vidua]|uniref:Uncharacterized protein n=1 Tax=Willisornis vidua TaxID=1566151 RepID=A0ABQ9DUV5_9PASS|nr:hypothetical protein WISP_01059 [Willisornis vidua]
MRFLWSPWCRSCETAVPLQPMEDHWDAEIHMQPVEEPMLEQVWCCDHCPGEPVPVPDHLLHKESLPNIQPKPALTKLQAFPSGPVTGHREEIWLLLSKV